MFIKKSVNSVRNFVLFPLIFDQKTGNNFKKKRNCCKKVIYNEYSHYIQSHMF